MELSINARKWLEARFSCWRSQLVSHSPWSSVYKIITSEGKVIFLKCVDPASRHEVDLAKYLSINIPEFVPNYIDGDSQHGFLLLDHHRGRYLEKIRLEDYQALLVNYAAIQSSMLNLPHLLPEFPCFSPNSIFKKADQFFISLKDSCAIPGFLSMSEATMFYEWYFSIRHKIVNFSLPASTLPFVLEHGDLHIGNVAFKNKNPVFCDWGDSCIAPLGLSLCALFGGCENFMSMFHKQRNKSIYKYLTACKSLDASTVDNDLIDQISSSVMLGSLYSLCSFQNYLDQNSSHILLIAHHIRFGVIDLFRSLKLIGLN